jgi:hypothetical protein
MERPQVTKKSSKKPRAPNRRPTQNFSDIARILAGSDAPPWLPGFLEWWSQGVRYDILVDEYRPSKLKTVKRLLGVAQAVALLQRELENPSIRNLLEASKNAGTNSRRNHRPERPIRSSRDRPIFRRIGRKERNKAGTGKARRSRRFQC